MTKKGARAGENIAVVSESCEKSQPKIALVCDWLTNPGGAEKVLLELHRMYPDAPIFTSQYNREKISWFKDADVRTGWMQIFPSFLRNFLGIFRQLYFSHLDLSDYDVVISVTGAEAKSVKVYNQKNGAKAYHLCYCHVPTQYYWQKYDYYVKNPGFGILNPLARLGLKLLVKPLRRADYRAAQCPDQFVTISHYAAEQIQKYYNREAEIIFPAVDVAKFTPNPNTDFPQNNAELSTKNRKISTKLHRNSTETEKLSTEKSTESDTFSTSFPQEQEMFSTKEQKLSTEKQDFSTGNHDFSTDSTGVDIKITGKIEKIIENESFFIISCRQVTWKRVDLAIEACKETGDNLLVVGQGPEHDNLVKLAGGAGNIFFLPWQSSASLAKLLRNASAYIFPSEEPFGIAAAEALAAGCPVLAYGEGGSCDIVVPGKNGLLFPEQTPASVVKIIRDFQMLAGHKRTNSKDSRNTQASQPEPTQATGISHDQGAYQQHSARLWPASKISASAEQFSTVHFETGIRKLVDRAQSERTQSERTQPCNTPSKPRTLIDKAILTLLLILPFALFMSYYPVITLGATTSMNLELSVPLIWLVVFDLAIVTKLITLLRQKRYHAVETTSESPLARLLNRSAHFPGITDRKIFLLALFPLYATVSIFWSGNQLRGILTAGIIWALFLAIFAILFVVPLVNLPRNFRKSVFISIFSASVLICIFCFMQSVADICGVPRETTLLCRGCTYQSFGFPHPSGLAIEPQFMGNLLLAPTLLGICLIVFYHKRSLPLTIVTILCSTTLFFTFSRGAIYAYAVALIFLIIMAIIKKVRLSLLFIIPIVSFLVSLMAQGIMATVGPTSDNFVTATTKAVHHLTLGIIDLRPEQAEESVDQAMNDDTPEPVKPDDSDNSANFSGYVAESTDVRLNLNTTALLVWRNAPGHPAIWQGFGCSLGGTSCIGSRQITLTSMYFGVGLGGAGTAMHKAFPNEVTSPKEIVQNQPISLLLELGIFGIDLLIFELIICFCPWFFSRRFVDGCRAAAQPDPYTNFWHNQYWILLSALILAYLVTLNFFSGLPNALHIYLMPPLLYLLGEKNLPTAREKRHQIDA